MSKTKGEDPHCVCGGVGWVKEGYCVTESKIIIYIGDSIDPK